MASWAAFARAEPAIAAAGERLLRAFTIGYLATIRRDGSPRLHPVTVTLADGDLYVVTIAESRKTADLRRDRRYALHAFPHSPTDEGWDDEELVVHGAASEVTDAARREAILRVHNDTVADADPMWALDIEGAFHKHRVDGRVVEDSWRRPSPASPTHHAGRQAAEVEVAPMETRHGARVLEIYGQGIATGVATFDTVVPDWTAWDAAHRPDCRFVALVDGEVAGFVALGPYSGRAVYSGVAWESVYVGTAFRGRGVGRALLDVLVPASEAAGVWTLLAGIQAENTPSIALHEAGGFRRVGVQERVGRDAGGVWRDVMLMERRRD